MASLVLATLPAITLGIGAVFTFTFLATRLRSLLLGIWAVVYGAAAAASVWLLNVTGANTGWQNDAGFVLMLAVMTVPTAHAFALRPRLTGGPACQEDAIAEAKWRMSLRDEARRIAASDPRLADELRIGRPDLDRSFDDGGLVDANRVPAKVLRQMPGIGAALAERIVQVRQQVGGFESVDDLSVTLALPPQALDHAADLLIFRK